ncbi:MAG TPA: hypothetical protein VG317_18300 [Pseudonocardiaceae bacterium]|nr:hypothetical protein [Pseudonocardiaceae bacterium]
MSLKDGALSDAPLPASGLDEVAAGLAEVSAEFAEQVGGPPTLGEFLAVLGWAVPANSKATDDTFSTPLTLRATLKGNKRYPNPEASRVGDLNDAIFVDAMDHLVAVVDQVSAATGTSVTPAEFASAIAQALRTGKIPLADVDGEDVRKLAVEAPKKRYPKPAVGDVLAIPARRGGYHLAVVVARDRFGTALGLFRGTSAVPRLGPTVRDAPLPHAVYTDDQLVITGVWRVVGHDEGLLALFPAEPAVYHKPGQWPGIDLGEFGAAETADGTMRLIGSAEARDVGLQDGTYRQTVLAEHLQRRLDDDAEGSRD